MVNHLYPIYIFFISITLIECSFSGVKQSNNPKTDTFDSIHDNTDDRGYTPISQNQDNIVTIIATDQDDSVSVNDDDNFVFQNNDNDVQTDCGYQFECSGTCKLLSLQCAEKSEAICTVCNEQACDYHAQNICNCSDKLEIDDKMVLFDETPIDFSDGNCLLEQGWQINSIAGSAFHCKQDEDELKNFYLESQVPAVKTNGPPYAYYNNFFDVDTLGNRFGVEIRFKFYYVNILGNNAFALYKEDLTNDRVLNGIPDDKVFAKVEYLPKAENHTDEVDLILRYGFTNERLRLDLIDSEENSYNPDTNTSSYTKPEITSQWLIIRFAFDLSASLFYIFVWESDFKHLMFASIHTLDKNNIPHGILLGNINIQNEPGFEAFDYWSHARIDYIHRFKWRPKCLDE